MENNHDFTKSLDKMQILANYNENLQSRSLDDAIRGATYRANEICRGMDDIAKEKAKRNKAVLDTAKNTKEISSKVKSINDSLDKEREERLNADSEIQVKIDEIIDSQKYANLKAIIVGIISAAAGVAFTIFATRCGWL